MKKLFSLLSFAYCISTLHAQTNVSGGIYTNTTWTLANSPYIVVDTVVVFPGVTLSIEPGVVVKFENGKQLEIRQATLNAIGNGIDSITFTSNSGSPVSGNYYGIYLHNSQSAVFKYCNFYFAANAIRGNVNDSLVVSNSNFISNNKGVYFYLGAKAFFDNCSFKLNTYAVYGSTTCSFRYCSLVNNNIGIDWCERAHVQQCVIDSNISFGIRTVQSDTILNCEIKYNGIGLVVSTSGGGDPSFVSENIIESNTIGIQLENGFNNDQIYCNMFCNNTSYDLKTTLSTNTNCVLNNYWCSTDSVIISSHIWDGYDDAGLGLITFIPFDTTQCYLTGCALGVSANVTNATCDTCHNGSATSIVTNGFAPYTYTWFTAPIQTTQTAIGMAPGTYTLCVTDGHGCTACNNSIFIDSTNCSGFSMYTNATNATCSACNDGAAWVIVNGGSAPYYYSWYTVPVQTTDTAINLMQGTYAVCVTDVYGCTICDSVAVGTGNCSAHFNLYPDTAAHHYYVVNMASGVAPLTYDWNWGDSTTHDTTPYPDHTYAQAGFYTICLGITDSVGCTNTFCTNFYLQHNTNAMVYVNVIPNGPVGIKENTLSTFSIYPNPTHSSFTIINTSDSTLSLIQILNPIGEIVYFEKLTGNDVQVIYPHLAAGFYFVQLSNVEGKATKKLIVE